MSEKKPPCFQILICLIKIWSVKSTENLLEVPDDAMVISECEKIEINDSYKQLIGSASVKFPRGTIIRKTITQLNEKEAATDSKVSVSIADSGVVEEVRKSVSQVAKVSSFSIGQRIRIYLGYTDDPAVAKMAKSNNFDASTSIYLNPNNLNRYMAHKSLHMMFDGYITKISMDSPVELYCENLAWRLKQITCPKRSLNSQTTINDMFSTKDGSLNLLNGTGIILHPSTEAMNIDLGHIDLHEGWTVADVIKFWAKYGINGFITEYNGKPALTIGRSYFYNAKQDSILNAQPQSSEPTKIYFDYHVAKNNLTFTSSDKRFLAVEAQGLGEDGKFFQMTILRNPEYDPNDPSSDGEFRVANESALTKKMKQRGVKPMSETKDKLKMDMYTKIPFHSRKIPTTRDELFEEATKYMESYNSNGIEGRLVLFGDLHLKTGTKVQLIDDRFPGKNGVYLVNEVRTTFGTGGYRQTISLPYCIKRDKKENE